MPPKEEQTIADGSFPDSKVSILKIVHFLPKIRILHGKFIYSYIYIFFETEKSFLEKLYTWQ